MKKASKLVTIILILMIIVVVGILSYYAFNYFKNKKINNEANDLMNDFDVNYPTITLAEYEDLVNKGIIKEDEEEKEDDISRANSRSSRNRNTSIRTTNRELDKLFAPKVVGTIRIPKTGIKYPIYSPPGEKVLEKGIGMLTTDNGLNKPGNTTLQGHNWRNRMFFSRNYLLKIGDSIFIKDKRGVQIEYIIYKKMNLKPTDAKYITRDTKGKREISLSTCSDAAKNRLVILAREK